MLGNRPLCSTPLCGQRSARPAPTPATVCPGPRRAVVEVCTPHRGSDRSLAVSCPPLPVQALTRPGRALEPAVANRGRSVETVTQPPKPGECC